MRKIYILALVLCMVGGISIYGGFSFVSFYAKPFYAIAISAFIVASALFITPFITRWTTVWFWLVVSPLVILVCSFFGVLTVNYFVDRSKEPGVYITVKGFMGTMTPTTTKFYIDVELRNDSAYKVTLERAAYDVYYRGERISSAEKTNTITVEEKITWSDHVEIVSDNFSQETVAFLYKNLEVNRGTLPLTVKGSIRLRFGSVISERPFEETYVAETIDPGWFSELEQPHIQ